MQGRPMRWVGWSRLILVALLVGPGSIGLAQPSPHLKMGNPSGAMTSEALPNNYLLDRPEFATSYDNARGTPNWVSWRLAKEDIGHAPRENFFADPGLPASFLRVDPAEYNGSGFDRGHMCPHGDRTATTTTSLATFAMTNIIPQAHDVNTMAWESLETYCRTLAATQGKVCYIIAGPSGQGGTGKSGLKQTTPDGKVVVPSQNWKVAMILDSDVATAAELTATTPIRLIAAIMPNADGKIGTDWKPFQTTVHQVEALTGYTFYSAVNPAVLRSLKEQRSPLPAIEDLAMPDSPAFRALKQAAAGLTYPSEVDEPFEVISWGVVDGPWTDAKLRNLTRQDPASRLERLPIDAFFARLVRPPVPQDQVKPATAERFALLLRTIRTELTGVEVVRIGRIETTIFIIGKASDGTVIAIKTTATET